MLVEHGRIDVEHSADHFGVSAATIRRDLDYLADQGTISPGDQNIIDYADTADEAWKIIRDFYDMS